MWVYDLLDNSVSIEKSIGLGVNVFLGLVFSLTMTIGLFEYVWMLVPHLSPAMQMVAEKVLEPVSIF